MGRHDPFGAVIVVSDWSSRAASWYRDLDESDRPRAWFELTDRDGLDDPDGRMLFETVVHEGGHVVVRQVELIPPGSVRRYWWRHLDDDDGFLTDQRLEPDEVEPVTAAEFAVAWNLPDEGASGL